MRPIAVLRPEPGASATAGRIAAAGMTALRLPLFAVVPVAWQVPDPAGFDSLLLTSANAVRHAGEGLRSLAGLPVLAVGQATADAARAAGLTVAVTGTHGVGALGEWAQAMGFARALHLAGRDRTEALALAADTRVVYASERVDPPADAVAALGGAVALVHSPRAGSALRDVAGDLRPSIRVVAISAEALEAIGGGWDSTAIAALPSDAALIDAARTLAIDPPAMREDKAP
ncbi:uroporphyrinogen-III synthase [Sphingomonas japonica]|uniref:Uroporphyrinogen-III synthase n=1 Tax=Sphingomonas japonica TaxID=511662 RepID=A0ABX0TYI1_9SPHN|nr:uroporphyrinogen-III synthase [Sphingomonas japonica]NIJ23370.1 uroporphyrinogen-III synthase [Sphingomonas japonica]